MQNFPLLCKGLYSNVNGTSPTITAAQLTANRGWTNQTPTGRGNLVALDAMQTVTRLDSGVSIPITVAVGGVQVFTNCSLNNYLLTARPASYHIAQLDQPEGQTITLNAGGAFGLASGGVVLHCYFQNGWNQPQVWQALQTAKLKCRYQDFSFIGVGGQKNQSSGTLTVPTGKGNVIGIMLMAENDGVNDEPGVALLSVNFNGVTVIDQVSAYLGAAICARPGLIFPLVVQGGSTLEIVADMSNGTIGRQMSAGVRLFFDDQINTTPYRPVC